VLVATSAVYATTSTVVEGDDGKCLLVDPALTAAEIAGLQLAVEARGLRPVGRWATHAHWDHLLAGRGWPDAPTWAAGGPGWLVRVRDAMHDDEVLTTWLEAHPEDSFPRVLTRVPAPFPEDADVDVYARLAWPGPRTLVVTTDGHAVAHGSLVLPDAGVLIAGDMLSDTEIPMFDVDGNAPVARYRSALDALAEAIERWDVRTLVPGHGSVARGDELAARLRADRAYVDAVEAGRPSDDPRLVTPWLALVDRQQRAVVAHR
jgi:hydroxyacylglutathione hydrolase